MLLTSAQIMREFTQMEAVVKRRTANSQQRNNFAQFCSMWKYLTLTMQLIMAAGNEALCSSQDKTEFVKELEKIAGHMGRYAKRHLWKRAGFMFSCYIGDKSNEAQARCNNLSNRELGKWNTFQLPLAHKN